MFWGQKCLFWGSDGDRKPDGVSSEQELQWCGARFRPGGFITWGDFSMQERRLAGGTGAAESCEEGVRVVRSSPTAPYIQIINPNYPSLAISLAF